MLLGLDFVRSFGYSCVCFCLVQFSGCPVVLPCPAVVTYLFAVDSWTSRTPALSYLDLDYFLPIQLYATGELHGLADHIKKEILLLELPTDLDGLIALAITVDKCLLQRD